jgi:hypothetical protein
MVDGRGVITGSGSLTSSHEGDKVAMINEHADERPAELMKGMSIMSEKSQII